MVLHCRLGGGEGLDQRFSRDGEGRYNADRKAIAPVAYMDQYAGEGFSASRGDGVVGGALSNVTVPVAKPGTAHPLRIPVRTEYFFALQRLVFGRYTLKSVPTRSV